MYFPCGMFVKEAFPSMFVTVKAPNGLRLQLAIMMLSAVPFSVTVKLIVYPFASVLDYADAVVASRRPNNSMANAMPFFMFPDFI